MSNVIDFTARLAEKRLREHNAVLAQMIAAEVFDFMLPAPVDFSVAMDGKNLPVYWQAPSDTEVK